MKRIKPALCQLAWCALLPLSALPPPFPAARHSTHGTVRLEAFFSPALGVRKRYAVYLPPSYLRTTRTRYPVVYLLHGRTGNEADWIVKGDLDAVADSLAAAGRPEMILVMPDGDNSFWVNWAGTQDYGSCAVDSTLAEAAAAFCARAQRYGD